MDENAGPSQLEILVGRDVSAVCFISDYVQVKFDELILTCYTLPSVRAPDGQTNPSSPDYADKLCTLIGKRVHSVAERPEEELSIHIEGGDAICVSLRPEDYECVEAAMLHQLGGDTFDVW